MGYFGILLLLWGEGWVLYLGGGLKEMGQWGGKGELLEILSKNVLSVYIYVLAK